MEETRYRQAFFFSFYYCFVVVCRCLSDDEISYFKHVFLRYTLRCMQEDERRPTREYALNMQRTFRFLFNFIYYCI